MLALNASLDEKLSTIFKMMDTDGNGTVDTEEFTAFLKKEQNKTTQALLVRSMDNDKKQLSLDEFRAFFAELIRKDIYTGAKLEEILGGIITSHQNGAAAEEVKQDENHNDALAMIPEHQEDGKHAKEEGDDTKKPHCIEADLHLSDDAGSNSSFYLMQ